jgi:hypothetical protein
MTTRRCDPYSRFVVRIPKRDLAESVLHLAAPLLEPMGPAPALADARLVVELAVNLWNARVAASKLWGRPSSKAMRELRAAMREMPEGLARFDALSDRWTKEFSWDPRLVGSWALETGEDGGLRLACDMALPDGVDAHVDPPAQKRIAIGGRFLDETRIPLGANTALGFTVADHFGKVVHHFEEQLGGV